MTDQIIRSGAAPVSKDVSVSTTLRNRSIELTKEFIAQSRVIAKGERIRDIQRLVDQYGGKRSKWVKKSSPVFESGGCYMNTIGISIIMLTDSKRN